MLNEFGCTCVFDRIKWTGEGYGFHHLNGPREYLVFRYDVVVLRGCFYVFKLLFVGM